MRCRNYSMFHHFHPLRLERCPNFHTNPCQSLALKDVNLRQICRRAMRSGVPMPPWLVWWISQFSRMNPLRVSIARVVVSSSGHRRMHGSRTEPSCHIFFSTYFIVQASGPCFRRCRKPVEIAMENQWEIRVDQSLFENIDVVFPIEFW